MFLSKHLTHSNRLLIKWYKPSAIPGPKPCSPLLMLGSQAWGMDQYEEMSQQGRGPGMMVLMVVQEPIMRMQSALNSRLRVLLRFANLALLGASSRPQPL
ncbi:hypothetical protein KC19_VG250100 [Ceratodon purpureus]|uniref:Uncharacterized protein n=1 Tax=Ceratodon purpureus TaxID=3225 RepID=A0A8T0HTB2_CERPU|nr:hypothetical protein KC19_VG250100 [Ceratodon purpureus]